MERDCLLLFGASPFAIVLAKRICATMGLKATIFDDSRESASQGRSELSSIGASVTLMISDTLSRDTLRNLFEDVLKSEHLRCLLIGKSASPWDTKVSEILRRNFYQKAALLEAARTSVAAGSVGIVLTSFSGSRAPQLTPTQKEQITAATAENLPELEFLQPSQIESSFHAFQLSNACLETRVRWEDAHWKRQGGALHCFSPGILTTSFSPDSGFGISPPDDGNDALSRTLSLF